MTIITDGESYILIVVAHNDILYFWWNYTHLFPI